MPTLGTDNTDTVKRALEVYSQWSQQIAPYVHAAVAGEVQVPRQSVTSEVWLTFALFWEGFDTRGPIWVNSRGEEYCPKYSWERQS